MDEKYFIVIRETVGQVVTCLTKGKDAEFAYEIVSHSFRDGSGTYFILEITKEDFEKYTHHNYVTAIGRFRYIKPPSEAVIEGEGLVYLLACGWVTGHSSLFKEGV